MDRFFRNRVFKLGKLYIQSLDAWEFTSERWVITGLREAKLFFGLLDCKCPICKVKTKFYIILCQAKGPCGFPIGRSQVLPLYTKHGGFLAFLDFMPLGNLQFSICPNGHEIARIMVNSGGGDGSDGYLIHQFKDSKMTQIACP